MGGVDHLIESHELEPGFYEDLRDLFPTIPPDIRSTGINEVRLGALDEVEDESAAWAHIP